jgi:AmpE protein
MRFLILLLTFVAQRKYNLTLSRQHDTWATQYLDFFEKQLPVVRHHTILYLAFGILLPAILLSLLLLLVDDLLFGSLTLFVNFVVLFFCLGCGYLKNSMDAYLNHWLRGRYQLALEALTSADIHIDNAETLSQAEIHQAACTAFMYQTFQRYFIIIFWFMAVGPTGALVARLAHVSSATTSVYRPQRVSFLCYLLEWVPARILGLTFALVGNFSAIIKPISGKLCNPYASALEILEFSAASALANTKFTYYPPSQPDTAIPNAVPNEKAVQLMGLRELLNRALVAWFGVLAIVAIVEWFVW